LTKKETAKKFIHPLGQLGHLQWVFKIELSSWCWLESFWAMDEWKNRHKNA